MRYKSYPQLKKKLNFCDYEIVNDKILVTHVEMPEYASNKKKVAKATEDLWGEGKGKYGYDTYTNCAKKIELRKDKYQITSKESTVV